MSVSQARVGGHYQRFMGISKALVV